MYINSTWAPPPARPALRLRPRTVPARFPQRPPGTRGAPDPSAKSDSSFLDSQERPPACFLAPVLFSPNPWSLRSRLFQIPFRPRHQQSLLWGDTSDPPNPFLPVIFETYFGGFAHKLGPTQQHCLYGGFLFLFFLIHLDQVSLLQTSLIRSVGSFILGYTFVRTWEILLGEKLHFDQQAREASVGGPRLI